MAITTYNDLTTEVKAYCARSDSTFSARFPTFVAMAEERIYHGAGQPNGDPLFSPPLRTKVLEATATLTTVDGEVTVPDDYNMIRKVVRSSDPTGITYLPPHRFDTEKVRGGGTLPLYCTVEVDTLKLAPSWDGDLSLYYYKRLDPLTQDAPSNDLLTTHPLVYFNAVMFEAFAFMQDTDLAGGWLAKHNSLIHGLNRTRHNVSVPGGRVRITARAIG